MTTKRLCPACQTQLPEALNVCSNCGNLCLPPKEVSTGKCDPDCLGWDVMETGEADYHIERCDECGRFETDEDAVLHIEITYRQMLDALSLALTFITDPGATEGFEAVEKAINAAINAAVGD